MEPSSNATRAFAAVLTHLIAILAARGILNQAEVLDLAKTAQRHAKR